MQKTQKYMYDYAIVGAGFAGSVLAESLASKGDKKVLIIDKRNHIGWEGDPFYPVPKPENQELYRKYAALAKEIPYVHFAGRLGTYRYYNMDQVVAQALTLYDKLIAKDALFGELATETLL